MSLNKEQQQKFVIDFRKKQILGSENLTQTPEIEKSRDDKMRDLHNIEEATDKFFNNDTTIKSK